MTDEMETEQGTPAEQVDIEVGGETYKVPAKFAEAYQRMSQQPAQVAVQRQTDDDEDFELDPVALVNDKKYLSRVIREQTRKAKEAAKEDMRKEYQAEQARKAWWDEFYDDNKDFRGFEDLVGTRFQRDLDSLASMKPGEAKKTLAKAVRSDIVRITEKFGKVEVQTDTTSLEGGSSRAAPRAQASPDDGGPKSLTEALRERAMRRRKASKE